MILNAFGVGDSFKIYVFVNLHFSIFNVADTAVARIHTHAHTGHTYHSPFALCSLTLTAFNAIKGLKFCAK